MTQGVAFLIRNDAKSFVFLAGPTQEVDQTRRFLWKSSSLVLKDTDPQVQRDGSRLSDTQEMEPLSSGVSTGTLSQAARKILAVLRAQSPHAGRRNQVYTYRHRQIEDRDASQRKFSAHRNMKMSPETSRGIETEGARADPPAQSDQALPFNENKMAQTLSLHPDGSGISSCFSLSGERENTPSVEEGRGVSKPLKNNELKGFCPENQNPFASENQLEQKEASGDVFEWKTEYKPEKKKGNVFTTEMHDGNNSSVGVTCLRTCQPENARVMPHHDKNVLMHTKFVLGDNTPVNIDSAQLQVIKARQEMESPEDKMDTALHLIVKEHGEDKRESFVENNDSADGKDESVMPPENTNESKRIEDSSRGSICRSKSSAFLALCYHNEEVPKRNINRRRSSAQLASKSTFPTGHISTSVQDLCAPAVNASLKMKNTNLPSPTAETYHPHLIPFLSLKRKREVHENHKAQPPPNVCLTWPPPKWKPPHRVLKREVNNLADSIHGTTTQSLANVGVVTGENKEKYNPKQLQQLQALPLKQAKEEAYVRGPHIQLKAHFLPTTLMFDPRVKDFEKLNTEEKMEIFEMARKASVLVLTLVYRDGSTQLDPEQKTTPPVCGLLMLMKSSADSEVGEDSLGPNDNIVYLKLQAWTKQQTHQDKELFMRDLLLQVLSRPQLVVCYKAKDLLRTALQCYKQEISWKQVAGCLIQDPQVSGWLLDPANPCSSYEDLLQKYCKIPRTTAVHGVKKVSQAISGLCSLYWLNVELSSRLQSLGLWDLYTDMELSMIPVLAVMESYHIHVDKEAFQRTSDMLGKKLKQLEQEAHRAAGEIFLITSNSQLRAVLFERLRLHERCENKKLPRTLNRQQSTSEAVLLQLQDLHPLPKIILEYRQVHKIKSTFVDGILSCVKNKDFISSKWHQTSAVTGRISSKHPNFQALPRQPLQITQKGSIQEKEEEVVKIHPRAMFIPQEGWTFVAADFCQVELRLLAHFSSDPELLRIFSHPQSDVFTMLASQWKGLSHTEVTSEDREHAKRIVYSVVYGAGRERLSGILGVSAEQASQFQDSFLQAYKDVQAFVQKTIQQCRQQGYVLSLMGRRRTLPNINVSDWAVRMQAERQAVNFVVQGSAADLCKTAMIRIFNLVSSSSRSARLVAQLHDELLYEVEDGEVQVFAALVKSTMESLQHIDHFGVHLKVPLKVAVSIGKSWGSMSELNIPATSPSAI
eukprot:XP_011618208.1 PREDICTED: DNA polymerase nu isoform X2 [Takifugu rubripes]